MAEADTKEEDIREEQDQPAANGDSLIGKDLQDYVIEARLGIGAMGVVYRAAHRLIGRAVAIKVLRPDVSRDPADMGRLLDEARIISSVRNRGIIDIFGAGTLDDGRNYLIMELLEGETLEERLAREQRLPIADALGILEEILGALSAAHQAGVVHRDLKPGNVFLVKEGHLTYVKLLDFGLARRNTQNVTRIAGTPDYISPEHARGRPAGPQADLYAFGVLCFRMLTGRLPFAGATPIEVMDKHVNRAPPVPFELNPEIPKVLSELILRLLAKEPGQRPESARIKADLHAAAGHLLKVEPQRSTQGASVRAKGGGEEARAPKVALLARLAHLRRRALERWPYVLGCALALWFLGVFAYVSRPSPPPSTPSTERRQRRIAQMLSEMQAQMSQSPQRRKSFEEELRRVKDVCETAHELEPCESQLLKLRAQFDQ